MLRASGPPYLPQALATPPPLAIERVAIVDVLRGEIITPRTVLVVAGRIAAIGTPETIDIPQAARRIEGRGRYLMPGLVDMHVHLFNNATRRPPNEWAFPLFVANGVTGVREMACAAADLPTLRGWQDARAEGRLV
ncbi:MAG: amidohydrolase family protein, partial [Chthoniobacterales bacterium]